MRGLGKEPVRRVEGGQSAFTLVEILIVAAIVATLATLAIPFYLRSRVTANETMAINSCRIIVASSQAYYASATPHTYPGTLAELAPPIANPPYIDALLGAATSTSSSKQGYYYLYERVSSQTYTLNAAPVTPSVTGSRYFYTDESGVIRVNPSGAAGPSDPPVE